MFRRKFPSYDPRLRVLARNLRKNSTLAEVLLWNALRARALGVEFHRQVPIDRYIVDFYCHESMMVIEVDGSSHDSEVVCVRDEEKSRRLESQGIHVLRFQNADILHSLPEVVESIRLALESLGHVEVTDEGVDCDE